MFCMGSLPALAALPVQSTDAGRIKQLQFDLTKISKAFTKQHFFSTKKLHDYC
jgi:hypothetical protein